MALPTVLLKAKNAVSKGKAAINAARASKSAGEEATGVLAGAIKGTVVGFLTTFLLPILIVVGVVVLIIAVFLMVMSVPLIVFGVNLDGSGGENSTTNKYCNMDPAKAEYAYEQLEGGLAIPHYRQTDSRWADDPMWDVDHGQWTTIGDYGCASAAFAMVASYLLDQKIYPDAVSEKIGADKEGGMNAWQGDFGTTSDLYGIARPTHADSWDAVEDAVENNKPVIANYISGSLFTTTGHFIVIRGKTEDGKFLVNDPSDNETGYKAGYINRKFTSDEMKQGFDWAVIFETKVCPEGSGIDYLQWAIDIANDDSHGYSQCARNGPDYDCSSLVYYSLLNSGYSEEELGGYAFNTTREFEILPQIGFERHPYNASELQAGDILWRNGHTGIYAGDGKVVQASSSRQSWPGKPFGYCGTTGDQDGTEIWVSQDSSSWEYYFRKG